MNATDILGYGFAGASYCVGCLTNPKECECAPDDLDENGLCASNCHGYGPNPIFGSDEHGPNGESCSRCLGYIIEPSEPEPCSDEFFEAYVECALWSSTDMRDDSGGMPLDENFNEADIRPESLASMRKDCDDFTSSNRELLDIAREAGWDDGRLGHDFWLSRNGHGAGFFDEYFGADTKLRAAFRELQKAAKAYGSSDLMPDAEPDENGDFPDGTMLDVN